MKIMVFYLPTDVTKHTSKTTVKERLIVNRIFENQEIMILSDKELIENNGFVLTFSDESSVNIGTRTVTNKGPGEIIIRDLPMWPPITDFLKEEKTFSSINCLSICGDMNNIIILPNEGTECLVSIGGSEDFAQKSSVYQQGDELHIETPESNSNIHINKGSIWVNGKRIQPQLDDDFGYIEIRCNSLYSLYVNVSGSGNIYSQVPIKSLKAEIKGATSIDAIQLENAELNVSGSGSLVANELNGCLYGRVSGSGSIEILTGVIDNADVTINGSGDLMIGGIVKTATLSHSGSGDMVVAHVLDEYTAQGTGSGSIRVLKTGI